MWEKTLQVYNEKIKIKLATNIFRENTNIVENKFCFTKNYLGDQQKGTSQQIITHSLNIYDLHNIAISI